MSDRSGREAEYVIVRNRKAKKSSHYYQDDDDYGDADDEVPITTTRRIVRSKPHVEQRVKYVTADELDAPHRRPRVTESSDRRVQIRKTTRGEQVILDEDDNVIKVIRNRRSPTPPPVIEQKHVGYRPRESRTIYYETSDGRVVARPPGQNRKNVLSTTKTQVVYPDDEPTRVIRRVIIDPRTGDRETVYEKDKPKKQQRVIIRQRAAEIPIDSDYEEEEPPYTRVVQRRADVSPRRDSRTKYVLMRRNNTQRSQPVYTVASTSGAALKNNHRIVYEAPSKKSSTTYVYSDGEKYYK